MLLKKLNFSLLIFLVLTLTLRIHVSAQTTPADPEMIRAARTMLHYFDTIYQKKMLGAMRGPDQALKVQQLTGEYPAMVEEDLTGWHETAWSDTYTSRVQEHINAMKEIWKEKKAIPGMCWHWGNPLTGGGTYTASKEKLTAEQFNNIVTEGTDEYNTMMEDLRKHADYLQQLTDENIPLIWRPLHEIDGGWFWWTDKTNPENTVKLWKIIYSYLVNERDMHNLIWVYSAGLGNPTKKDMEYRRSFYPGSAWCDMVGIDLYGWDYRDKGIYEFWNTSQSYQEAYDVMKALAPDKLILLAETDAMPNMEKTFQEHQNFAKWLWAMPWWADDERNPDEWIMQTYTHENVIMQHELPDFADTSTMTNVAGQSVNQHLFSLYPVPCGDVLSVDPYGNYELLVISLTGTSVIKTHSGNQIDTSDIPPGVYFLSIKTEHVAELKMFVKTAN